MIKFIQKSEA